MDVRIFDFLFFSNLVAILISIIILFIQLKGQSREFVGLTFVLLLSFSCDVAAEIFFRLHIKTQNIGGTTYFILAPSLFGYFFYHCLNWRSAKIQIIALVALLTTFSAYNSAFLQKDGMNSYSAILLSLFILGCSIIYYYKLLKELPTDRVQDLPLFWIISAFFFAHAGKLVLESVSHYMTTVRNDNLIVLWIFHNSLNVLGNLIIGYGVWLQLRNRKKNYGQDIIRKFDPR